MAAANVSRLTSQELEACRPVGGEGGRVLRAYCPFHGSDKQRSLRIITDSNRFSCYACGAWGYVDDDERSALPRGFIPPRRLISPPVQLPSPRADLAELAKRYCAALPDSIGERYLRWRGISLDLAREYGIGYAASGQWAHVDPASGRPIRQWKYGRVVIPHTDIEGRVVNLYGRAVGSHTVPKNLRHDHLSGPKGYFNASALDCCNEPVYVCEGPFDALSLLAAGAPRAVAIYGIAGWRWQWAKAAFLIFAFDADEAGARWREIAWQAVLRGKVVSTLEPTAYGGHKDINDAWASRTFRLPAATTAESLDSQPANPQDIDVV